MNLNFKHKETKKVMKRISDFLTEKYGEVKPEWEVVLYMLGNNLDMYKDCQKEIETNGIFEANSYRKNPLISTLKDLQATILKEVQHLGLSPYADSKIKQAAEDDTEDFIEALTGGNDNESGEI